MLGRNVWVVYDEKKDEFYLKSGNSKQCTSFVSSIGIDEIKRQNKWEICDLLIGYKNCISKKIKLAGVIGKKKDMSIRLRISRVLQIILSTY